MFGVSSSLFLLNSTIRYHLGQYRELHPELVEKLTESFYISRTGDLDAKCAFQLYSDAKRILGEGAFNLRKFCTNNSQLQNKIDMVEEALSTEKYYPRVFWFHKGRRSPASAQRRTQSPRSVLEYR